MNELLKLVSTVASESASAIQNAEAAMRAAIDEVCKLRHQDAAQRVAIESLGRSVERLHDHLKFVLPMAKGYAAEHPVGLNAEMVLRAEVVAEVEGKTRRELLDKHEASGFHTVYELYRIAIGVADPKAVAIAALADLGINFAAEEARVRAIHADKGCACARSDA